jgi:hypothetical protein
VGNPDLSAPAGPEPRRGLVIFPAAAASPSGEAQDSRQAPRLAEWWLVLVALALAAAVIVVALMAR